MGHDSSSGILHGWHGRVEAQARDAALSLASRRRSICGGLCGEPGKASWLALSCLCQPISSIPSGWSLLVPFVPVHILCTLSLHTLAGTQRLGTCPSWTAGDVGTERLQIGARCGALDSRCGSAVFLQATTVSSLMTEKDQHVWMNQRDPEGLYTLGPLALLTGQRISISWQCNSFPGRKEEVKLWHRNTCLQLFRWFTPLEIFLNRENLQGRSGKKREENTTKLEFWIQVIYQPEGCISWIVFILLFNSLFSLFKISVCVLPGILIDGNEPKLIKVIADTASPGVFPHSLSLLFCQLSVKTPSSFKSAIFGSTSHMKWNS